MRRNSLAGLTAALLMVGTSPNALAVQMTQTDRDIQIAAPGPEGYTLELNRQFGTWRRLSDARGGSYDMPLGPTAALGHPSLNPGNGDLQTRYARDQLAMLKVYPAGDGSNAIQNPVAAWNSGGSLSAPEETGGNVRTTFSSGSGDRLEYTFTDAGIQVKVSGGRAEYRVVFLVPLPDALGSVQTPQGVQYLQGFNSRTIDTSAFEVLSPYRDQSMRVDFGDATHGVHVEMQDQGRTPDRANIEHTMHPHLGVAFTVRKDETFTISFPQAEGRQHDLLRVLAMQPMYEGAPAGSTRGFWQAPSLALAAGDRLEFKPVDGATIAALSPAEGSLRAFVADVSQGDYDFYWKQVQPNSQFHKPGNYVFPKDDFWQPVGADAQGETITVDTSSLEPGIYKVRVETEDSGAPDRVLVQGDVYVAVGQEETRKAIFAQDLRTTFLRGETIDLSYRGKGAFSLKLEDSNGRSVPLGDHRIDGDTPRTANFHLDTSRLRPGPYKIIADHSGSARAAVYNFTLTDPERASNVAIEDNSLYPAPFQTDLPRDFFGGINPSPWKHNFAQEFSEIGLSHMRRTLEGEPVYTPQRQLSLFASLYSDSFAGENFGDYSLANPWFDSFVQHRMGYWQGIQTRALSFTKVTVLDEYLNGMTQRLARTAQQLRRYPVFGGMNIDVDVAGTTPDIGLKYAEFPAERMNTYQQRTKQAMDQDFETWVEQNRQELEALGIGELTRSNEKAWYRYLADLWPRTNKRYQDVLHGIDTNLKQTSNTEYNHAPTREGMYPPLLYKGLDLTSMEAWGDMRFNPLHNAYWTEIASGVRELSLAQGVDPGPVWMQGQAYADYTDDHLPRHWWETIGAGGDGVGYAANIFGLNMYGIQSHVLDEKRDVAVQMAREVEQLGPMYKSIGRERDVAILYSFQEGAQDSKPWYAGQFSNYIYVAYYVLSHMQYTPAIVFEESIRAGLLDKYKVLVLAHQEQPLPADILAKIQEFQANGGVVISDEHTTSPVPGLRKITGVDFSEINQSIPTERFANERYQRVRGPLAAALNGILQRPAATREENSLLYWFKDPNARYLIALNNKMLPNDPANYTDNPNDATVDTGRFGHMVGVDLLRLEPHKERLYLRDGANVVINMTTHERVTPQEDEHGRYVELDYSRANYNLFAFFNSEVTDMAIQASGATLGQPFTVNVTADRPLPITVELRGPNGEVRAKRHTTTNAPVELFLGVNDEPGGWQVAVTDWVSGRHTEAALSVSAGSNDPLLTPAGEVMVYDAASVHKRITDGEKLTIIVDAAQQELLPVAQDLQQRLQGMGVEAELWSAPNVVDMPMDWEYSEGDRSLRQRIFNGEVIGQRYWRGNRYDPSWELRDGHHIARDVILLGDAGHNRFIRELQEAHVLRRGISPEFPGEGNAVIQHVHAHFDGRFGAVIIGGTDVAGVQKGVERLVSVDPNAPDTLSLTRARFLRSLGFGATRTTSGGTSPSNGNSSTVAENGPALEDLPVQGSNDVTPNVGGPTVSSVVVSPDGKHVAVSVMTHGNNLLLMDDSGNVRWRTHVGGGERVTVKAVTNSGVVAANVGKDAELLDANGNLVLRLRGQRVQWLAPNGQEIVTQSVNKVQRMRVSDQGIVWSFDHGLPDDEYTANWEFVPDPKNTMLVGPSWNSMFDSHEEIDRPMDDLFLMGVDLRTGNQMWRKERFPASAVSFSQNGNFVGAARKRLYLEQNGDVQKNYTGGHDSLLVMLDRQGNTKFEERADIQIGRALPADDGSIIVGIPYLSQPHAFLGRAGGELEQIPLPVGEVRDGCLMQNGHDVALVADNGTVTVFDEQRELWSFEHAREEKLWCGHPTVWIGSLDSVLNRLTKRGAVVWTHDVAEDVLDETPPAGMSMATP